MKSLQDHKTVCFLTDIVLTEIVKVYTENII